MSIHTWIIAGVVVGFLASKLVLRAGDGLLRDLGLGVAGAVLAGIAFNALKTAEATGLDIFGLVVTVAGASAMLVAYYTFFPRVRQG
jgi:uncharacterized membrane protein YeaQ/YmgE (transglycosylase-associated protein family)